MKEVKSIFEGFKGDNHMCLDPLMMLILLFNEEHFGCIDTINVVISILIWDVHLMVMQRCLILVELTGIVILGVICVPVDFLDNFRLIR